MTNKPSNSVAIDSSIPGHSADDSEISKLKDKVAELQQTVAVLYTIEEFRIIGFYLYHVTSIRPSNSRGASGSLTASLNIDYDRGSSSYYC